MAIATDSTTNVPTIVRVWSQATGSDIQAALGIALPSGILLMHGGASAVSPAELMAIRGLFGKELACTLADRKLLVIDGGTATGVAQLVGEMRSTFKMTFPLIGVCPEAEVTWPGGPTGEGRHQLDSNHTHFVLTPGKRWGDETPYLFALSERLAADVPSLALLINGGAIARQEMLANVACGRKIVVLRGSGRLADQIAAVWAGDLASPDEELDRIVRNGRITVVDLAEGPAKLAAVVEQNLRAESFA